MRRARCSPNNNGFQQRRHSAACGHAWPKVRIPGRSICATSTIYLGLCYERLGLHAEALDQYELVLDADPKNESADAGKKRMSTRPGPERGPGRSVPAEARENLKKPKDQQDWSELYEEVDKIAGTRDLDETSKLIYRAQLMIMSEDFDAAAKTLSGGAFDLSPKNLTVHRLVISAGPT